MSTRLTPTGFHGKPVKIFPRSHSLTGHGDLADQLGEAALAIAPGVHVLAEQHDFARASVSKLFRLVDDVAPRARDFRAARVRHDTISAEFVAAFLDGEERAGIGPSPRREGVEFRDRRHGCRRRCPVQIKAHR